MRPSSTSLAIFAGILFLISGNVIAFGQSPVMTLSSHSLNFIGGDWAPKVIGAIAVTNNRGLTTLTPSVPNQGQTPWLEVDTQPRVFEGASTIEIQITCDSTKAIVGVHTGQVVLTSAAGGSETVEVTFTVQTRSISISASSVTLNSADSEWAPAVVNLTLSVTGPYAPFTVTPDVTWIEGPYNSSVAENATATVFIWAYARRTTPGSHTGKVTITAQGYDAVVVNVTFNVSASVTTAVPSPLNVSVAAGASTTSSLNVTTTSKLPLKIYSSMPGSVRAEPDQISTSPGVFNLFIDAAQLSPGAVQTRLDLVDAYSVVRLQVPVVISVTGGTGGFESFPTSVNFSAASSTSGIQQSQLLLTNRGSTANFTATPSASWLSVSPSSGLLTTNASASLTVQANPASMPTGRHEASILFTAPGLSPLSVPVVFNIGTPAKVTVTPTNISLATTGQAAGKDITITSPGVPLMFDTIPLVSWLKASPPSGSVPAGGTAVIRVWADPDSTPSGLQNSRITVVTGGDLHQVYVSVNDSSGAQQPSLFPVTLSLSAASGSSTIASSQATLKNPGAAASFTATSDQPWLSVSPASGQVAAGSSTTLSIQAHAQGLPAGTHNGVITINAGSQVLTLPVAFTLTSPASLFVSPASIEFNGLGSSPPARRMVSVTTQSGAAAQFTFTHQSTGNWLTAEQSGGQLSVGVNPLLLPSSPSTGTIQIASVPSDGRTYTVQVTARRASVPASWAMPQVADGGEFTTSITLVNPSSSAATASLRFRRNKQDGSYSTEDWTPAIASGAALNAIQIPAKSVVTVETLGVAVETSSGWVEVTGPSELGGFAVFRQTRPTGGVQEATVPMSGAGSARVVLPYDNISGWVTSFAAINRDTSAPLAINYELRDSGGASLGSGPLIVLPAAGHLAARIVDIFPSSNGKRGSLVLAASRDAISALALRFSPQGAFTSLETTPETPSSSAVRQVFAQIADGGGFNTLLTLQNNNPAAVTAHLRFHRAVAGGAGATEVWEPPFEGSTSTTGIVIPAGGTYAVRTAGIGDAPTSGWAEVESSAPVSGSAVFSFRPGQAIPQEASVALKAGQMAGFYLPFDNTLGFVTSVALANIDANTVARLPVVLRDESGAILGEETIEIPASGHLAFETVNRLAATAGKRGSAEFAIQSGYVVAIGLRFSPAGPFTSFQPQYW